MQQFQPDSAPDTGNSDEQPLVIEDLPVEAAQNQTTTTRKSKWQRSLPSLIAGGLLLLGAVVVGAHLLPQAPGGQPSHGTSPRTAPPSTPPATPIPNGGPGVPDYSVHPTVVDGVVYVSTSANVTYALIGSTGTLLWRSTTKGATYLPPMVARGIVYVNTNLSDTASSIYALQATDGKLLWSHLLNEGKNGWITGFGLEHGVLYAGVNDEASPGGQVYALQSQTGRENWRTTSATPPTYGILATGMLYISSATGSADALNIRDGSRLWHHRMAGEIHTPPVLAGDSLYIGASTGVLYAFDQYQKCRSRTERRSVPTAR